MSLLDYLSSGLYLVFSEAVWFGVGGAMGFIGLFAGCHNASYFGYPGTPGGVMAALSFMPLITSPLCAVVSALIAAFYSRSPVGVRVPAMLCLNAVMFAVLYAYAMWAMVGDTKGIKQNYHSDVP